MTREDRIRQRRLAELEAAWKAHERLRFKIGMFGIVLQAAATAGVAAAAIWLLS